MSVLETPRIYFKGQITWDPITTNNYCTNYNETASETLLPPAADQVKAFREQSISQVGTMGNWNPHGTHRARFYNSAICGFDIGNGLQTEDPFVNAATSLQGMLVDLEPFGAFSSQLFFDSISFGVDGGYRILAPRTSRFTARYINFGRNQVNTMIAGVASVAWQTSFSKADGLRVDPFDSAALKSLAAALNHDDIVGLTVRFNAYRTIYYDDPDLTNGSPASAAAAKELIAKLKAGGFQPNPARSLMVGVIGLWRKGEPAHEAGDRALIQNGDSPAGSAWCRINGTSLALDLSNSVMEVDKNLTKQNLGTLSVVAVDPASQAVTNLGSFGYNQYDRTAYEATAGIVTIPLTADTAHASANQDIQLRDSSGNLLLAESPYRAIPATPNLYLDEGDHVKAHFQMYHRGAPDNSSVGLNLYRMDSSGDRATNVTPMKADDHGILTLPIQAGDGAVTAYVPAFTDAEEPVGGINPQVNTYMYVRVLPADRAIAELPPIWDNLYANVLANWNAMAPCMDNWLNLSDPAQVKASAGLLKRLTDPANFESFLFMPVTRDMSAGERALLYKFLDAAPVKAAEPVEKLHAFAQLSRSMRRV